MKYVILTNVSELRFRVLFLQGFSPVKIGHTPIEANFCNGLQQRVNLAIKGLVLQVFN